MLMLLPGLALGWQGQVSACWQVLRSLAAYPIMGVIMHLFCMALATVTVSLLRFLFPAGVWDFLSSRLMLVLYLLLGPFAGYLGGAVHESWKSRVMETPLHRALLLPGKWEEPCCLLLFW